MHRDRSGTPEIAAGIDGVTNVDDALTVDPSQENADTSPDAAAKSSFSQWIRDVTSTARVKTNLVANGNTRGLAIDVDTTRNVVTLSGAVGSRKEKMLAGMIARNTDGVAGVQNHLDIDEQS